MNQPFGLLDTSAVIRLEEFSMEQLPSAGYISAVTLAELSVGTLLTDDPSEQVSRQDQLQRAVVEFGEPLPFDGDAARAFAEVAASLRKNGGKRKAKSFDALIAATAKANGLPLYTCNAKDFVNITGLHVIDLGW